ATRSPETGEEDKVIAKTKIYSGIQGAQHIHILEAASEESQAVMIGKTIEHLVGGISMFSMDAGKADSALNDEYSFSDMAVLYRTKKQSEVLSKVFEKAGIPSQTADRENIFLQKGIKELISSLRIIIDRGTFYDQEVLSPYYKKFTTLSLKEIKQKSTGQILKHLIDHLGIDKIISKSKKSVQTLELLAKEAEQYSDPAVFYEHIAMKKDVDTVEFQAERVSLMTMHAAKGLEFKVVFIAGCMDGLIPFFNKCENIDEERRLFYVAMTRAEELLYLCHAKKRIVYGKTVATRRSPFLDAIEESLKHYSRSGLKKAEKKDCGQQLDLFGKV
ncbi:MAG: ATP-binding domain-containing protein, partial [Desulfamplus sp.]|nr:ATP-binding domain-containing protein [Desulfamplus sp.]